jgi:sterol desaturase/sphingolipid hydroxylase (fatty acid hydroxylase superfamily)
VVLRLARAGLDGIVPAGVRGAFGAQPFALQAVEAIVFGDFLVYWFHRACHKFDWLWRFHAVHHSAEHLDWLAAHREHPLDGITTQLFQNLPALALGLRFDFLAAFVVLRSAWGIFIHSNVRLPLGPIGLLLGAPELHHFHHAKLGRTEHNFANLAPWLDVVFGTYHRPSGAETYPLGLDQPWPRGYLAQLLRPLLPARLGGYLHSLYSEKNSLGPQLPPFGH